MFTHYKVLLLLTLSLCFSVQLKAQKELWGFVGQGGEYNSGTLFKTDYNGQNVEVKYHFPRIQGDGPTKAMIWDNGKVLLTTEYGGTEDDGLLISYDTSTNTSQVLFQFTDSMGIGPVGGLLKTSTGQIYGTAKGGGANSRGVIYTFDPSTAQFTVVHHFDMTNGAAPLVGLMEANNGLLYGSTGMGGAAGQGVLFSFDPTTNTYTKLFDFVRATTGSGSTAILTESTDGTLWGTCSAGGASNNGTIFKYHIASDSFDMVAEFQGAQNGSRPSSALYEMNGKLYGLCSSGGASFGGAIFEFDTASSVINNLANFNSVLMGSSPHEMSLSIASNKIIGTCSRGGTKNNGTIING